MIRSHFGLQRNPFDPEDLTLLAQQQEVFDILHVHAQQGGRCLVLGEPGTGKSVLKQSLLTHDPKRMITPVVCCSKFEDTGKACDVCDSASWKTLERPR
jgi:type II secretory pathway predicted ATPase ExeA